MSAIVQEDERSQPRGCVVFLNGFPGTGKFTIATALRSMLRNVESRLLDNHLIIDSAEAVHPGRGPAHKALRKRIRDAMFEDLKHLPGRDIVIILTGCLAASPEDLSVFAEHVAIAQYRKVPFCCFTISVNDKEHFWRLQSPDRVWGQKRKLSEPAILKDMMAEHKLLDPTDEATIGRVARGIEMQHRFVNTTELSVEESANLVLEAIANGTVKE